MQPSSPSLILIVDDNPTNLEVMSEALVDAGYEVAIATSGERALLQIQRSQPDLILLDIMMPGIDGFTTCQRIKEDLGFTDIPIIFMTAIADEDNKVRGLELGAVDYITKPFQEREVLARVATHLSLKKTEHLLRRSEERLESILNSLEEVVWSMTQGPLNFIYLNPALEEVFGCSMQEFMDNPQLWFDMVYPEDQARVQKAFNILQKDEAMEMEYRIINKHGLVRWLRVRAQCREDISLQPHHGGAIFGPAPLRIDGIMHDISDRKQFETRLIHDAHHDDLTGLLNRKYFIEQTNERLSALKADSSTPFAVLFIDLDRFKKINDSLGHHVGDLLLKTIATILSDILRPKDIIARLGGDEFTLLLENIRSSEDAIRVAERIHTRLSTPLTIGENLLYTSASIGIVMATKDYNNAEQLLRDADIAMYQSKKRSKAGWEVFNHSMYEASVKQLEIERDLRQAINTPQIKLFYQPIVRLENQKLLGFEALVRWIHPERGMVSPMDFIPIAEESGLIEPLGEQILWQACKQLQTWQSEFPNAQNLKMSVNLSSKQLQKEDFIDLIDRIMAETHISGQHLKLEITETILMKNHQSIQELFQKLLERNISLSLDDFGTGYSSLSYLHRFPLNELKIDRSFINRIETDNQSSEIVKTITTLAKTLDMDVVAEGVETEAQLEYLHKMHCHIVQGYFFSKPLPSSEATEWVMAQAAPSNELNVPEKVQVPSEVV